MRLPGNRDREIDLEIPGLGGLLRNLRAGQAVHCRLRVWGSVEGAGDGELRAKAVEGNEITVWVREAIFRCSLFIYKPFSEMDPPASKSASHFTGKRHISCLSSILLGGVWGVYKNLGSKQRGYSQHQCRCEKVSDSGRSVGGDTLFTNQVV